MAALAAASVRANQHAGGIQGVLAEHPHLRCAHADIGPRFHRRKQRCQPLRMRDSVVIQGREKPRARSFVPQIDGGSETDVAFRLHDRRAGLLREIQRRCVLLLPIVHNDDFEIPPRLPLERRQAIQQLLIHGKRGDHDGNRRFGQASILPWAPIFIPLQIGRALSDAGNVGMSVAIQIRHGTGGRRHSAAIQHLLRPMGAASIVGRINENAAARAAKSGNNLIPAVSVEIRGGDCVAIGQRVVDERTLAVLVHRNLIAVPGLDGRNVALLAEMPHRYVA